MATNEMTNNSITEYDVVALRFIALAVEALRREEREAKEASKAPVGHGTYSYHLADLLKASRHLDALVENAMNTALGVRVGNKVFQRVLNGEVLEVADYEAAGISVWKRTRA